MNWCGFILILLSGLEKGFSLEVFTTTDVWESWNTDRNAGAVLLDENISIGSDITICWRFMEFITTNGYLISSEL